MILSRLTFLLLASVCAGGVLSAQVKVPQKEKDSYLRFEINGVPDKIISKFQPNPNASSGYAGWYGPDKYYVLTVNMKEPLTDQWTDFTFTFTPNRSGKVWLRIGGRWFKDPEERHWLLINQVKLNGKLLPNGDFKKYREKKPEVYRPNNWILHNRADYYLDAGENKTPACLINHDSPITTSFQVRAGEPNTVTIRAKVPPKRLVPKYIAPKKINQKNRFY